MTSLSVRVVVGYGLQPKIDMNSHPEKIRCDQLFGTEHKGCSVLGKLLWRAHSFTCYALEEAEPQQSFPQGKYSFVTSLTTSSEHDNNMLYRFTNICVCFPYEQPKSSVVVQKLLPWTHTVVYFDWITHAPFCCPKSSLGLIRRWK